MGGVGDGGYTWVVVGIFWVVVLMMGSGGFILESGRSWWICFGWWVYLEKWWVMMGLFWVMVGGGGIFWVAVGGGGWWWEVAQFIITPFMPLL